MALAVLASALPFSLEMIALRNLTALSFGTLMSLEPAIAALSVCLSRRATIVVTVACAQRDYHGVYWLYLYSPENRQAAV